MCNQQRLSWRHMYPVMVFKKATETVWSLGTCGHMPVREIGAGSYSGKAFISTVGDMPLRESSEVIALE